MADRLLARARAALAGDANDTTDWVHVAVLAAEAKEVLGGLSRTLALDAVEIQNDAEVRAELSFAGMAAELEVNHRLDVLEKEVAVVQRVGQDEGAWGEQDEEASRHRLLQTVARLRLRFSEQEQVTAAEDCLCRVARYRRQLRAERESFFLSRFAAWYVDLVTRAGTNVRRLVVASVVCVLAFWALYTLLLLNHPTAGEGAVQRVGAAWWQSIYTFFELQPGLTDYDPLKMHQGPGTPPDGSLPLWLVGYRVAILLELLIAYTHLGLLMALLYRRVTKRAP